MWEWLVEPMALATGDVLILSCAQPFFLVVGFIIGVVATYRAHSRGLLDD